MKQWEAEKKLHSEALHNLYPSPNIIRMINPRRMRWVGHVTRTREKRNAYMILVGRPEGKGPLGRPGRRYNDNIKINLRAIKWGDMYWNNLAQNRDQ
jgi:hypothetical protein